MENTKKFEKFYNALLAYKEQYGDLNVPHRYCINGYRLGYAVNNVRSGKYVLYDSEIAMLNQIDFLWWVRPNFEKVYQMFLDYVEKHGDCNVQINYITEEGIALGGIVHNLRSGLRKITDEQREKLDEIGFVWNVAVSFETVCSALIGYKKQYGNCNVPYSYVTLEGIKLGYIMYSIKKEKRKVTEEQRAKLIEIGYQL